MKKPHRISLSEIVKGQLTALAKTHPDSSSVELTRNAKGDTQIKVSAASAGSEALEVTSARAQKTYDELAKKYKGPVGGAN